MKSFVVLDFLYLYINTFALNLYQKAVSKEFKPL